MATDFTFLIPVFNEGNNVYSMLDTLNDIKIIDSYEIIIIDDGSWDESNLIIKNNMDKIKGANSFFTHAGKKGYGYTLKEGIASAKGKKIITYTPGDMMTFNNILKLIEASSKADLIIGKKKQPNQISIYSGVQRDVLSISLYLSSGLKISDPTSTIKVLNKKDFEHIELLSYDMKIHFEIIQKYLKKKLTILEIILDDKN